MLSRENLAFTREYRYNISINKRKAGSVMEENTRRPQNPRRRRKTRAEIIKETYLPTMILILTVILVVIFIVGSLSRRSDT